MAEIECRYYRPMCTREYLVKCNHPEADSFYADCDYYTEDPSDKRINPRCKYLYWDKVTFEKPAKSYRWDMFGLKIGREFIPIDSIEYLRIGTQEEITKEAK
jgi:hypothetical protein